MARSIALAACVAAAFVIFFLSARTPAPLARSAPPMAFSAGRAMVDVVAMAPVPHPIGSAANHAVRDHLFTRMTALSLSPRIQRDESIATRLVGGQSYVSGGVVENVIGILQGRDRAAPALTLMAHYDSVPGSPGAADDITGVASILEIVRALEAGPRPARDVMVVITDGEEAGLLGARAFFADDPLAARAGFILNLESRGGGGRASMFETGAANGRAIDVFRRTAVRPQANSLTEFVYKLLPNDTDYTVARKRGLPGFNYAFIGRQFDYHSPSSTIAALDQGSVQHIGDEVLGTARALALAPALPARAPDAVYGNLLGDWMIDYPAWAGWLLLAATAGALVVAAVRSRRAAPWAWSDLAAGAGASLLILVGSALALDAARASTGVAAGWMEYRPLLARFPPFEIAMGLVGMGSLLAIAGACALWRRRDGPIAGLWIGLLATGLIAALALQVFAPTTGFVVAWPTAAGAACAALTAGATGRRRVGWTLSLVLVVLGLAWLGGLFHSLLQGLDRADACGFVVWLAAMLILPFAWPPQSERLRGVLGGLVVLAIGFGVAVWLNVTNPWSARYPLAVMPLYVVESGSGRAWRASPLPLDGWTRAVLRADGGTLERLRFPGFAEPMTAARARAVPRSVSPVSVARSADGTVVVSAPMAVGAILRLDLRADVPVGAAAADGKPTPLLAEPGQWTHLRWQAAPGGVTVAFRPRAPGRLDLRWAQILDHWPGAAEPLPPMPADLMAWDIAGSTVVVGADRFTWTK